MRLFKAALCTFALLNTVVVEAAMRDGIYEMQMAALAEEKTIQQPPAVTPEILSMLGMDGTEQVDPDILSQKKTRYGEDVEGFVLVSLSMPKHSLETLLEELANSYEGKNINVLFRGWDTSEPAVTYRKVSALLPDNSPNVGFDPTIFRKLEVEHAPTFVIKTENGWKQIQGDTSYYNAVEIVNGLYPEDTSRLQSYPIIEPDILAYTHQKIREYDWNKDIYETTQKIKNRLPSRVELPLAESSYSYLVDPTITLEKDVVHKGVVVARAGQRVNPNKHQTFSKHFVFLDVTDEAQVLLFERLKEKLKFPLKAISTVMPSEQEAEALEPRIGSISQIDPWIVKRFGLEAYPSLAMQMGEKMKIQVFDMENLNEQ